MNSTMKTPNKLTKITKELSAQTVAVKIARSQREAKTAIESRPNKSDRNKVPNEEKVMKSNSRETPGRFQNRDFIIKL